MSWIPCRRRCLRDGDVDGTVLPFFTCSRWNTCRSYMYSFTCFCYKWCVKFSFGSWGNKFNCFTCSGYMCYRNFLFPCSHFFHLGCILIPKYLFHLIGEQVKHNSSIKSLFHIFPFLGILKFRKQIILSLVSATSDALSSLSVHGVINLIVSLVRDTCVIEIFYSLVHTSFISVAYWFRNISFTWSRNKWNIILR
jgi:hypothetical protein